MSPVQKLQVSDVENSVAFFLRLLEFEVERTDQVATLRLANGQSLELAEAAEFKPGMARLMVDDVRSVHEHVETKALAPFTKVKRQPWDTTEFAILDPDRNQLTMYSMSVT